MHDQDATVRIAVNGAVLDHGTVRGFSVEP
jgi:hypothetical protein